MQIFFYGSTASANAYLNSRRRFFAAAWSPILPNVVIIATLLSLPDAGDGRWELARRAQRRPPALDARARRDARHRLDGARADPCRRCSAPGSGSGRCSSCRHPAVRRLLVLSGWTLGYVVANQVAVVVIRNLADPGSRRLWPRTSRPSRSSCCPTACWRCRSPRRSSPSWRAPCPPATGPRSSTARRSACG